MAKVAIVEAKPSRTNFNQAFDNKFEFDRYALCSDASVKRILKKHVDIEFNPDEYDWVILVGADPVKNYLKNVSVSDHSGKVVEEKYIPIINPAMSTFKPEAERLWLESKDSLLKYVLGERQVVSYSTDKFYGIQDEQQAYDYVLAAIASPNQFVAIDSETTALDPRSGHILGVSLCYERDHGAYIDSNCISERVERAFQELFHKKKVIFHNAKFDLAFFMYHFGWDFPDYEDTMLLHYCIDENPGSHGLKQLALKMTEYGDYEAPLHEYMAEDRKRNGILKDNYSWERIPFDIMKTYAAIDSVVTFLIYLKLKPTVQKNTKLNRVYNEILIPACSAILRMQDNGVPFERSRLEKAQLMMQTDIDASVAKLYENPVIAQFEEAQGKPFNPGSTQQLRKLLFDFLGLQPTGRKTGTGADSTDKEVLAELAEQSEIPGLILEIRQKAKLKNTYLDKIIPALDSDSRLRTNFNIHSTTSGRLSSSGKLNMQQLPRDNPAVKGCIKARPGYKIVSMDLTTAEVYIAAILSGDKKLQAIFKEGGDFHSMIAKLVFKLDCAVEDVKKLYPLLRQAAKSTTFGILYQAGAYTVARQITKESGIKCSEDQAQEYIDDYFKQFKQLKKWIDTNKAFIQENGFTYSHFGRKRRLPNVFSSDRGIRSHTTRSGINFLVQSPASDVNLLAAVEMMQYIEEHKHDWRIFALVHDSILAEIPENEVDAYCEILRGYVQKDRGLSMPGHPIGCDFEVGDDYSFGKYEKYEAEWDKKNEMEGISQRNSVQHHIELVEDVD
jgi:DNA polymerase I-like protein with 3'-5' exonuclease and polymerase domains